MLEMFKANKASKLKNTNHKSMQVCTQLYDFFYVKFIILSVALIADALLEELTLQPIGGCSYY